ncbi:MAG: LL-diaminopimelate aminotransferase [Dehalococcoidia bacterium]|jgi:LL-diaminopimelate aminotransferase|nr:LL-diaminopimelate aminotransferase [Chloroflexota bacterium]MDP7612949.1 LL-diaminopimelate aminotransferase [Dehalococcoidia bacterium]
MELAKRVKNLPPYLFVQISRAIAEKKAQGIDVISFGIGDPDIPTPNSVIETLKSASDNKINHRYPESEGLPVLRKNISEFYKKRFGVNLDPETQIINLIGAKEGIAHAALCFIDPGDIAISPDPAYPVYEIGTMFAGGKCHMVQLRQENGYLLDPTDIPTDVAKKAKVLWLNYPNNPTGATANLEYFENLVLFCKEFDIALLHDACYTEVTYDGYVAPSVLQVNGAIDVCMEFHSLSKTANMTGWRVGMAVGNSEMVNALMRVKSNIDSGLPQAIQQMGITALHLSKGWINSNNEIYRKRRDKVVSVLNQIGVHTNPPKAGLYIWTPVPKGYSSSQFASDLLEQVNVVVTPGNGYGLGGEGYIRLSLTIPDDQIDEGLRRLSQFRIKG